MTYGERIRSARKARGWTQRELAERLGVARASVGEWERCETRPRAELRKALDRVTGVTVGPPPRERRGSAPRRGEPEHGHDVCWLGYLHYGTDRSSWGCRECPATWESPLTVEKLAGVECEAEQGRAA